MKTCSVTQGTDPATGEFRLCGKPAVTEFRGSDGVTYYECEQHAPTTRGPLFKVGARVSVPGYRVGQFLTGRIVRVGHKHVVVEFIVPTTGKARQKSFRAEEVRA